MKTLFSASVLAGLLISLSLTAQTIRTMEEIPHFYENHPLKMHDICLTVFNYTESTRNSGIPQVCQRWCAYYRLHLKGAILCTNKTADETQSFFKNYPNLITLKIFPCLPLAYIFNSDINLSKISNLTITENSNTDLSIFQHIATNLSQLTSLSVTQKPLTIQIDTVKPNILSDFNANLGKLQHLNTLAIANLPLSNKTLVTLSLNCPNLIHFTLFNCTGFTNQGFKAIAKMTELKTLGFSKCNDFLKSRNNFYTQHEIQTNYNAMISSLSKLTTLSMSDCPDLLHNHIPALAQLINLTMLDILTSTSSHWTILGTLGNDINFLAALKILKLADTPSLSPRHRTTLKQKRPSLEIINY